jgi:hypothetical protein
MRETAKGAPLLPNKIFLCLRHSLAQPKFHLDGHILLALFLPAFINANRRQKMTSLSQIQIQNLIENWSKKEFTIYLVPVAKIIVKERNETWLLAEADPENPSVAYGLCKPDDHFAFISEINLNSDYEVDHAFKANYMVDTYKAAEWCYGELIYDENILQTFVHEKIEPTQYKLF